MTKRPEATLELSYITGRTRSRRRQSSSAWGSVGRLLKRHLGWYGRGCVSRQPREQRGEPLEVQWFDEVRVEARFLRATPVGLLTPAGERHQRDGLTPFLRADATGDLIAIEQRHADIEQCDFRHMAHRGLERERTVGRAVDLMTS